MEEDNIEVQEVPFDMSKETLKSIRLWIDKITQLSVGVMSGQPIDNNDMIILKQKMVKQLIILSSPLLGDDLDEIEEFFSEIKINVGDIRTGETSWARKIPTYTKVVDYKFDKCVQGIEKSLKKYFIPTFSKGEKY